MVVTREEAVNGSLKCLFHQDHATSISEIKSDVKDLWHYTGTKLSRGMAIWLFGVGIAALGGLLYLHLGMAKDISLVQRDLAVIKTLISMDKEKGE